MSDIQEPFHETGIERWRRTFPWLHLLRVPRIAARGGMLFVGFLASYLLMTLDVLTLGITAKNQLPTFAVLLADPTSTALTVAGPNSTMYAVLAVLGGREMTVFPENLVLSLLIFAVFGLMLSRLAAAEFAAAEKIPLENLFGFALRKFPALLLGGLFPLLCLFVCWLGVSGFLMLEKIPVIGGWLGGIAYGGSLLLLFLAMCFFVGLVVGWPLLVAVLAVENSDGFDAWSRSFDYLRSRFFFLVIGFSGTMLLGLVIWGIAAEFTGIVFQWLDAWQARILGLPEADVAARSSATFEEGTQGFQNLWKTLWLCALNGYLYTLYWSTVTSLYFLIRLDVDRTPLNEYQRDQRR